MKRAIITVYVDYEEAEADVSYFMDVISDAIVDTGATYSIHVNTSADYKIESGE